MFQSVGVLLDYQNVQLTARDVFLSPAAPPADALVDPLRMAERLVSGRRRGGELAAVRVFRGRPNPNRQARAAAANDAQKEAWEVDRRVSVVRRNLAYRGWPDLPPIEKGIDVALAVDLIHGAMLERYDVAIVFTHDADLLPALEVTFEDTGTHLEIACWTGARPLWFPELLREGRHLPYCHFLDERDFEGVRDRRTYV